jgi:hypothetical protein
MDPPSQYIGDQPMFCRMSPTAYGEDKAINIMGLCGLTCTIA